MRRLITPVFTAFISALLTATSHQAPRQKPRTPETALDRYVAAPDPNFAWKVVRELPAEAQPPR